MARLAALAGSVVLVVSIGVLPARAGAAPHLTSFTPQSGPVGTNVTINGTSFTGTTSVRFNGTAAPFTVNGAGTEVSTMVPGGAATGPITITTPNGTAFTSSFTVTAAALRASPTSLRGTVPSEPR